MPTRYVEVLSAQRPFDIGPDNNDRCQISCNYYFDAATPPVNFEREVCQFIANAGYGTLSTDMFFGLKVVLPAGDGPYVTVIQTSGLPTKETHNGDRYEQPTCQIVVTALDYEVAMARAIQIWRLFDGLRGASVTL